MKKPLVVSAFRFCLSLALGLCLVAVDGRTPAAADTIQLGQAFGTLSKDAMTFQNNPNNGAGSAPGFLSGTNSQPSVRRGFIAFDLSTIPGNAIVTDVQLRLVIGQVAGSGGGGGGSGPTIGLHPMLQDWARPLGQAEPATGASTSSSLGGIAQGNPAQAGDVTWNVPTFGGAATWGAPGGQSGVDYASTASASLVQTNTVGDISLWLSTPSLVADVQGWLTSPGTNYGWMLKNVDETSAQTFRGFYSRNYNPDPTIPNLENYWPQLIVSYQVPEPTSLALLAAGMALVLPLRVARRRRAVR